MRCKRLVGRQIVWPIRVSARRQLDVREVVGEREHVRAIQLGVGSARLHS